MSIKALYMGTPPQSIVGMIKIVMAATMLIVAVSRGAKIPGYLADLELVEVLEPQTAHMLSQISFWALVAALGALPVSVAGLGLREAGYVYFLANIGGAAMPQAVAFSLLWLGVLVTASAVGGVVFLTDRRPLPFAGPFRPTR